MTAKDDSVVKTGLVLSGGGAFGAYEVGVIQALYGGKCPSTSGVALDADVFAGTSVGNFNAAVLAMNKDGAAASVERLYSIWTKDIADKGDGRGNGVYRIRGGAGDYLDPRTPGGPLEHLKQMFSDATAFSGLAASGARKILLGEGNPLQRAAGLFDISVLLDVEPFRNLVRNSIDPRALHNSPKSIVVTATNWSSGGAEPYDLNNPSVTDEETWAAIRASAAIPCLFPPVWMLDNYFIDGGVVMNAPIKPAVGKGATELHVVSLDPSVGDLPGEYAENTWDAFNRVYTAMVASKITADIESARAINRGVEIIERVAAGEKVAGADGARFVKAADFIYRKLRKEQRLPRKLTIHRYHPKKALGGLLGMLNFEQAAIEEMIDQGYRDACEHKCLENGCVIPAASAQPKSGGG